MKVTLVYRGCHPSGGIERVVWEAARHLCGAHDVRVVAAEARGLPRTVEVLLTRPSQSVAAFRSEASAAMGPAPGLVVCFGADCPPADVLVMGSVHRAWVKAGAAIRVGRVPVPGYARRLLWRHQVRLYLERQALKAVRGPVVAVSEGVRNDLHSLYGLPLARMEVVPNGFDPGQCSPVRRADLRAAMRAQLDLSEGDVALLLVANEYHRKGLGVLLEAMAFLKEPRLRLLLVGKTAPAAYGARIRQLGLEDDVRYCGPTDDVALFHAAADLLVLPTQYEAFGSVIIEALASGLPVIASKLAGASAVIKAGRNGLLLADPLDAAELASLLVQGLDPGARRAWSERARDSVTGYEWSAVMERFEAVLSRAAEQLSVGTRA